MTPLIHPSLVTFVDSDRRDKLGRRYGARRPTQRRDSLRASTGSDDRPAFIRPLRRHAACVASGR